jgi:hypothetical protein
MDETNDWTRRVDQMTAATAHEQLRAVIGEAQEMLVRFNATASEQGSLLLDAQRELESSMDRKMAQVSTELAESIAAVRVEIASLERPTMPSASVEESRAMNDVAARLSSLEEAHRALETRIDQARSSSEERFDSIMARLEETAGLEDRAAARMVDLLATAFAGLRNVAGNTQSSNTRHDPAVARPQR